MIVLDEVTAAAVALAAAEYIAAAPASEESHFLASHIGKMGIMTPAGSLAAPALVEAYNGAAQIADRFAAEAASTGDELAMRRAAAHLRQASRLLAGSAVTQRIPRISDEEAAERIRAGHHSDATGPLMKRAGFRDTMPKIEATERVDPCKACATRIRRGLEGQCPSCATERTRTEFDPRRRQEIPVQDVELARAIAADARLDEIRARHRVIVAPVEDEDSVEEIQIDLGGES